ncbi:hypothetical protein EMCG_01046 [[Emmonsia] crescens]|uniref:Uncharacterized protein n=1 Tax=[Emmonsia] crescens TaxID=73230 RepID=A0A0G2JC46_9EURO|nr:hypothetical protein EMCG_01046 [Emmonsia crescens UAMH 3008]
MQPAGAVPTHPLALLMDRTVRWNISGLGPTPAARRPGYEKTEGVPTPNWEAKRVADPPGTDSDSWMALLKLCPAGVVQLSPYITAVVFEWLALYKGVKIIAQDKRPWTTCREQLS